MAQLDLLVKVAVQGARELDGLGGKLSSTGATLTRNVTLPLLAAGAGFGKLAIDAEKSQAKLKSVFKTMGASAFTSIEALNEHAEAMANATTFDDDAIAEAQAVLLTFGEITGDAFTEATESAADLAAFFETDMETAALQLGKALQNPVDGLARLGRQGIIFSDEQKAAVAAMQEAGDMAGAQALILDEVQRQVGSVAEDLAATAGGQLTQAMNELGEAGEALGVFLLPAIGAVAGALKGMAEGFQLLPGPVQGGIVAFLTLAIAIGPIVGLVGGVITAFGKVGAAFKILSTLLLTNPFVALAAAVIALVALVVLNWDKIVEVVQGAIRAISALLDNASRAIGRIGDRIWRPIGEGFAAAIDFIKGVWNAFARWWNGIQIGVPAFDIPFVGTFGGFNIGLPDLPYLAEGGIVNSPTLAVIGERGPEAVVPLDKAPMVQETHIHIDYYGPQPDSDEELVEVLREAAPFIDGRLRLANG